MKYTNPEKAVFITRHNRFTASVLLNGEAVLCHVKNTGRLTELLQKDAPVYVVRSDNPSRKTQYDLIAAEKDGALFNIDSIAPNYAAGEYLKKLFPDFTIKSEVKYKSSRFDFFAQKDKRKIFIEVKGVTLIKDGVALFPDAPTERGIKHLDELISCINEGFEAYILFVIQTANADIFSPNTKTHPAFGEKLKEARLSGVNIMAVKTTVSPDSMSITQAVPVLLQDGLTKTTM